jgi:hypothetical protein
MRGKTHRTFHVVKTASYISCLLSRVTYMHALLFCNDSFDLGNPSVGSRCTFCAWDLKGTQKLHLI